MRTNTENFVKIVQTSRPWVANLWAKLQILTVLGALFPHFCPDIPAIWQEGVDLQSPIHAQFRVYRSNVSPLHGEKP